MKIIWINIILSGDNAVVIALAARSLPPHQQKKAILFGSGAAVVVVGLGKFLQVRHHQKETAAD
jgi:predicted tellurium resistance membrane protein TerC